MEIDGSGATPDPGRGKKRPPSPSTPGDEDDDAEWLVSDSASDDDENQGENSPFTVDEFPTATCDPEEQIYVVYKHPKTQLRGPLPIRCYGKHVLAAEYNLDDKSESMRDTIEPLCNYVYRREINGCEAVSLKRKTGAGRLSLSSPARVISIFTRVLIEFELYVRTETLPEDEPKGDCLIEGCTEFTNLHEYKSFVEHRRMYGERCALDVKYMVLMNAVEALVEVKVIRFGAIAGGVNLRLHAKTSSFDEVIRLFQGAAPEPGSAMTFVVAVERHNNLDLYIEAAPREDYSFVGKEKKPMSCSWWQYSFESDYHGTDEQEVELGEAAELSVKVIWRSYR